MVNKLLVRLVGLVFVFFTEGVMATQEPDYTVISQAGDMALRDYAPQLIAHVTVSGSAREASNKGFRLLADFIFGNNTVIGDGSVKQANIAMTAPVILNAQAVQSQKISMTAPVILAAQPDEPITNRPRWQVSFIMPKHYTEQTLPTPNNPAVKIKAVPNKHYAAVRFSGLAGQKKVERKTAKLLQWLNQQGYKPQGEPKLARYNPPWTLPFLRRNEVLIEYSQ